MLIEIWSDVLCPFCYIGKRHLEAALAQFPHQDGVEVVWKSFELNPKADLNADASVSMEAMLAAKFGLAAGNVRSMTNRVTQMAAEAGLSYSLMNGIPTNSFDAHRAIHLAHKHGLQDAAEERLFAAYMIEGRHIGDRETIVELMSQIGLDAEEVRRTLTDKAFTEDVRRDEREAQQIGVNGVPFFVFDRKFAVSGAQPIDAFLEALNEAWSQSQPAVAASRSTNPAGE